MTINAPTYLKSRCRRRCSSTLPLTPPFPQRTNNMAVSVMPVVHEQMHQRASQNDEIRQPPEQMRAMLDDQIGEGRGTQGPDHPARQLIDTAACCWVVVHDAVSMTPNRRYLNPIATRAKAVSVRSHLE